MKKSILIPVALLFVSGMAVAGTETTDEEMAPTTPSFEELDINMDGVLTRDEVAGVEGLDFDEADQDGDGVLSQEEYEEAIGG